MHHALPLTIINSVKQQIFTFIAISLKSKSKDFDAHKHLEILHTQIEYIEQFKKLLIQNKLLMLIIINTMICNHYYNGK